jgi:DNA-binding GntR family transcriptional regulator
MGVALRSHQVRRQVGGLLLGLLDGVLDHRNPAEQLLSLVVLQSEHGPEVARRLDIKPGEPVNQTTYRFFADRRPIQVSQSWEPLSITGGTPIENPEEGPAIGVIARMDTMGQAVDHVIEKVTARAATRDEVKRLELPARGTYVLVIERTHLVGDKPVETCDIIFPGDRYELTYDIPVELKA